jgi:hypothetical protein
MPRSPLNTQHPREWELALRREMPMAIGLQLRTKSELPNELPLHEPTIQDKEDDPYAQIVGTC